MKRLARYTCAMAVLPGSICGAQSEAGETALAHEEIGVFNFPLIVTHAPDDAERLFVAERAGVIKIVRNGTILPTPFLDITPQVYSQAEGGLLGFTFHPEFQTNRKLYLHYTEAPGEPEAISVIEEYQASLADPDVVDPGSARTILRIQQSGVHHLGGWIGFGRASDSLDYLYMAFGDSGDPANAQDLSMLFGKILRVDVDGDDFPGDPNRNYAIPPSNPFVNEPGEDEIWIWGMRNPFRCSFDPVTGDLWFGDVGPATFEEVNLQPAKSGGGENYGWGCVQDSPGGCSDLIPPVHEYENTGCAAVIGGFVYRGCDIPDMYGTYLFADFCIRKIWTFRYDGTTVTEFRDRTDELPGLDRIPSLGEDASGELYIANMETGRVLKIVPAAPVTSETTCPESPDAFASPFGGAVIGDASLLCDSDDNRLVVVNRLPVSPLLPFIRVETWAHTHFCDLSFTSIEYTIEGGVDARVPGGQHPDTMRTLIRNYAAGVFELVDQRATVDPLVDEVITHIQGTNADDYVDAASGEIRVRLDVFDPGDALNAGWKLRVDVYAVTVRN